MTARPMRVLIADDERPARLRLRELLAAEEGIEIIGEAADGAEAVELIERDAPDVVLLDVEMPELDGFGVLAAIPDERLPLVIFVTAFEHYAVRAFDAQALDYVTKPVARARLSAAIARARARLETPVSRTNALIELARAQRRRTADRIAVKAGTRTRIVPVAAIDYLAAAGNYVEIYAGPDRYLLRASLTEMEEKLPPAHFARIHRRVIVNLTRVVELRPAANRGDAIVVIQGGQELPLSRMYRAKVGAMLGEG